MTIKFISDDDLATREKPCYSNDIAFQVPVEVSFSLPGYTEQPVSAQELTKWLAENPEAAAEALKGRLENWGDGGFDRYVMNKIKEDALEMAEKGLIKFVSAGTEELERGDW